MNLRVQWRKKEKEKKKTHTTELSSCISRKILPGGVTQVVKCLRSKHEFKPQCRQKKNPKPFPSSLFSKPLQESLIWTVSKITSLLPAVVEVPIVQFLEKRQH
jgi:hypothetical protein